MTKYWPPIECQYTQRQNKAPILPPSEAVLSATFVVQSQAAAGSTPILTYFPVGRNLPFLESLPSYRSNTLLWSVGLVKRHSQCVRCLWVLTTLYRCTSCHCCSTWRAYNHAVSLRNLVIAIALCWIDPLSKQRNTTSKQIQQSTIRGILNKVITIHGS